VLCMAQAARPLKQLQRAAFPCREASVAAADS
jgi:hypothetical protein